MIDEEEVRAARDREEAKAKIAKERAWKRDVHIASESLHYKLTNALSLRSVEGEEEFSPEATAAAEKIIADHTVEEIESGLSLARFISSTARPMCTTCRGRGYYLFREAGQSKNSWSVCDCVINRAAKEKHEREQKTVPGRNERNEAKEKVERDRLIEARETLVRAEREHAEALAPHVEKITAIKAEGADYYTRRSLIVAEREAEIAQATLCGAAEMEADRIARERADLCEVSQKRVGAAVAGYHLYEDDSPTDIDHRTTERRRVLHRSVDDLNELVKLSNEADLWLGWRAGFGAHRRNCDARIDRLDAELAVLDTINAAIAERLAVAQRDHDRVARHCAPKIEKAKARVRRLAYIAGEPLGDAQ